MNYKVESSNISSNIAFYSKKMQGFSLQTKPDYSFQTLNSENI